MQHLQLFLEKFPKIPIIHWLQASSPITMAHVKGNTISHSTPIRKILGNELEHSISFLWSINNIK